MLYDDPPNGVRKPGELHVSVRNLSIKARHAIDSNYNIVLFLASYSQYETLSDANFASRPSVWFRLCSYHLPGTVRQWRRPGRTDRYPCSGQQQRMLAVFAPFQFL